MVNIKSVYKLIMIMLCYYICLVIYEICYDKKVIVTTNLHLTTVKTS